VGEQYVERHPVTGDAAVDEAIGTLDGLAAVALRDQVTVYDAVNGALVDRLNESSE
jgi:hypothetical protein